MAHPHPATPAWDLPAWKSLLGGAAGFALGILWLIAGIWKITDPINAAVRMTQALVPASLSLPAAVLFGIGETFAGVLLLVPRFRRWGAWLSVVLLLAFLGYFAANYSTLRGEECNCFPWVKRAVGPGFFVGDGVMLLMAVLAGWWARPSEGRRPAVVILGAVCVFALVCYGMTAVRETGRRAPAQVMVDGKPFSLLGGRIFVYFFDPQCSHCDAAARAMARYNWVDTKVVAVATATPHFAQEFLRDTGLKAALTTDVKLLRDAFPFVDPPYAVALENGRQRASLTQFDEAEPKATLKRLGFVE